MHVMGVANLIIEMDTQYVCSMLSNPNIQPKAAINCWITAILLFDFKLIHVPAEINHGPDGLSRHEPISGKDNDKGNPEECVKAPPMVGPTWTRVCLTLGSDCLPALSQRTALLLPCVSWTAYCSHAHDSMIWMIQGCISMSHCL